ncbi:MAG: histidine phosphatase family protein [Deltaproteobacteria bacterium]|nr:histidine phosphatase family protein [Deltaproteobacteria bacterium]
MNTYTRLYLARHGQVENFSEGTYNGHKDVDINELGVRQMEAVADRLKDENLAGVYSSDLIRTKKGADIIAAEHDLIPESYSTLRELNVKLWEGLTANEIEEKFPGAFDEWRKNIAGYRIPGGESIRDMSIRVRLALKEILNANRGGNVVVVAHGAVNRVLLADAMGLDLNNIYSIEQDYGCLNIIDYFPEYTVIKLINGRLLDEKS